LQISWSFSNGLLRYESGNENLWSRTLSGRLVRYAVRLACEAGNLPIFRDASAQIGRGAVPECFLNASFSHVSGHCAQAVSMGDGPRGTPWIDGEQATPAQKETSVKRFAVAAIALSLLGASVAMADDHHDRGGRDGWSGEHRDFGGRRDDQRWQREERGRDRHEWREDDRHNDADRWREHRDWEGHHDWRGGRYQDDDDYRRGYHYGWHRGERLSPVYYAPRYVVRDYSAYQLPEPPYGCRWVRVDNNVVLAAIATGVVLDIVYNVF
jgi:Ni/Co efflux regulator RcnB